MRRATARPRCLTGALLALFLLSAPLPRPATANTPVVESGLALAQTGGGQLHLASPALRIVTLAPHLAELVYLAGAGDRLLATVEYSDFPDAANDLPRIGDAFRFDLERLVALAPDLVIAWDSGNPDAALAAMDDLGLPVWRTEVRSVQDMAWLIRQLGRATDLDTETTASGVEQRWQAIERRYADRDIVTYFYQVSERPLYTVNGDHLISRGLATCGAANVFRDLPGLAPQIAPEAVLQRNPDALVTGRFDPATDPLAQWRDWPRLNAIRDEALVYLPANLINRATPRLLDAVEQACEQFDALRGRTAIQRQEQGQRP